MKDLNLLFLTILLFFSNISNAAKCDCGIVQKGIPQNTRIYKGSDANAGRYPWMIFLKIDAFVATPQQRFSIFGGSLISRKHILTAAHPFHHPETQM